MKNFRIFFYSVFALIVGIGLPVQAQEDSERSWKQEKCVRYTDAWQKALTLFDRDKMSADFARAHQAFIDSECDHENRVCPVSDYDLEVANAMVVASMNAGTASTFPPFTCRDENSGLPNYKGKK